MGHITRVDEESRVLSPPESGSLPVQVRCPPSNATTCCATPNVERRQCVLGRGRDLCPLPTAL
eukprot:5915130-Prymnesium_polylepis.1